MIGTELHVFSTLFIDFLLLCRRPFNTPSRPHISRSADGSVGLTRKKWASASLRSSAQTAAPSDTKIRNIVVGGIVTEKASISRSKAPVRHDELIEERNRKAAEWLHCEKQQVPPTDP